MEYRVLAELLPAVCLFPQVMKFEDLKELGSEVAAKAGGKYRQEGKNYTVEGEWVWGFRNFRFNNILITFSIMKDLCISRFGPFLALRAKLLQRGFCSFCAAH